MKPLRLALAAAVATLAMAGAPAHAVSLFGVNLIVNGDAEAGAGSTDGDTLVAVPGFVVNGNFNVVGYAVGGGFLETTDPGPVDRGNNFFAGGPENDHSSATQLIDISAGAATIDSGADFALEGWLGGFSSQDDHAVLQITFLGGAGDVLGTAALPTVLSGDRSGSTALLLRQGTGVLPVGTRSISVLLDMTRTDGSYNDGYADNLSLVLSAAPVPEAPSALLLAVGLVALGVKRRRRSN